MFGWLIKMAFGENSLWYNGKKDKIITACRNEYGGIELNTELQSCWTENEAEAMQYCNHIRASQVKRTLGKKAEVIEYEIQEQSAVQELR